MIPSQETAPAQARQFTAEDFIVKVGERTVDCNKVLPLTAGDWRKLRKEGIDPMTMGYQAQARTLSFPLMEVLAFYVLRKAEPSLTQDELDGMTWVAISKLASNAMATEGPGAAPIDTPTSTASFSSPNGGAGDLATSTD